MGFGSSTIITDYQNAKGERKYADLPFDDAQVAADNLTKDFARVKQEKEALEAQVTAITAQKEALENDKAAIEAEKASIEKELKTANSQVKVLTTAITASPKVVTTLAELKSAMGKAGTIVLEADIDNTGGYANGVFSSICRVINLNGHTTTTARANYPSIMVRGSEKVVINGPGSLVNNTAGSPVIWTTTVDSEVVINGGDFVATNHTECIYSEKGTITINGGSFRTTGGDSSYLINCLDTNYNSGEAKIIIKGGKFYGFDPGTRSTETDGTLFIADGYKSTKLPDEEIDGVMYEVYEVTKA